MPTVVTSFQQRNKRYHVVFSFDNDLTMAVVTDKKTMSPVIAQMTLEDYASTLIVREYETINPLGEQLAKKIQRELEDNVLGKASFLRYMVVSPGHFPELFGGRSVVTSYGMGFAERYVQIQGLLRRKKLLPALSGVKGTTRAEQRQYKKKYETLLRKHALVIAQERMSHGPVHKPPPSYLSNSN
jgi:hypothetical protein